jgi:hypothetical protein
LGVAAAESSRKVVPIYGVNSRFDPFELNTVFEESVISKGALDGAGEVAGNGLAYHEESYLGGWELGNATND